MRGNVSTDFGNLGADFMAGNDGHLDHRVQTAIGIQVTTAESYIMYLEQYLVCSALRFLNVYNLHH